MEKISTNKMGTKPIFPLLVTMALPPMVSMMVQSLYNIIDSIFVAQYSEVALTAVSLAFPIQNLILAIAVGTGVGVNSFISRKLGQKDFENANNAVTLGLILSVLSAMLFAVIGNLIIGPFFHMFTDSAEIYNLSIDYTKIIIFFCFGPIIQINIEKILQATGKMVYPMILQIIGAVVNIILDPILIFGLFGMPELGIKGAAIATIIGQLTSLTCSILVLVFSKHDVKIAIKNFKPSFAMIKSIYTVAFPSMFMIALGSVLVTGLNSILIGFSTVAVSVFGVYFKLQTFVFMPVSGLTQGAMPIMGYNYGANNKDRLNKCISDSLKIALFILSIGTLIFMLFPKQLLSMFNASEEMISVGTTALRVLCISYIPSAFTLIYSTLFQSIGKGVYSLVLFLLRQFIIVLPMAWILSNFIGLTGIWCAFIISESVSAVVSLILMSYVKNTNMIFQ